MVFIFADESQIQFEISQELPILSAKQTEEIEKNWQSVLAKNPKAFSSYSYGCSEVAFKNGKYVVKLNKTDYKTYLWARNQNLYIPGTYATGTHPIVKNPKNNSYYFVQKSSGAEIGKNSYDNIGGIVEFVEDLESKTFSSHLNNELVRELKEETNSVTVGNINIMGFYYDYPNSSRIGIVTYCETQISKLTDAENVQFIEIPEDNLQSFYIENKNKLHEVLIPQLEFYLAYLNRKS